MKRVLSVIFAFIIGVGAGIAVDHFYLGSLGEQFNVVTLQEQVKEVAELATEQETYTVMETYEGDAKQLLGVDIPFTSKEMQLTFNGTIKAGINADKIRIDANDTLGTIDVKLPHSEILSHEIDEDSIQIVAIKNGLFNRVTPENTNEIRKTGKEKKEKEILGTDFLAKADEQAVMEIETLIKAAYPEAKVNVSVE